MVRLSYLYHCANEIIPLYQNGTDREDEGKSPTKSPDASAHKDVKTRFVSRFWPRDPNGKIIKPHNIHGKETSNGLDLWGETVYDFYRTERIPGLWNLSTLTTGSKMAAWVKSVGELDHAKDEIDWAETVEGDPVQLTPHDVGERVEDFEMRVQLRLVGESMTQDNSSTISEENSSTNKGTSSSPKSVFDSSRQPAPWPLGPFTAHTDLPCLEHRIPQHLLPKKLIIHDPYNLLDGRDCDNDHVKWTDAPDHVHTYNLHFFDAGKQNTVDHGTSEGSTHSKPQKDLLIFTEVNDWESCETPGTFTVTSMPILAHLPPPPPPPTSTEEAHLYVSASHRTGSGHHSFVYSAEWELPRSVLVKDKLCQECVIENAKDIYQKGGGDVQMVGQMDGDEREAFAKTMEGKVTITVEHIPAVVVSKIHRSDVEAQMESDGKGKGKEKEEEGPLGEMEIVKRAQVERMMDYKGPVRCIPTTVEWQNPERGPYCNHIRESTTLHSDVPLTSKVRVVAKLSVRGDSHLEREAKNYEDFPSHLFENWNGFNIIPPLHDPVPVSAVVPQFYGYYVPEEVEIKTGTDEEGEKSMSHPPYLSPILLLEDCGTPVEPEELNIDDREECASLYYRLHHAGWIHGSVYTRNILKRIKSNPRPTFRDILGLVKPQQSFRLIDFGRSYKDENKYVRSGAIEEMAIAEMLRVHIYA
jgi:hypothetical protein